MSATPGGAGWPDPRKTHALGVRIGSPGDSHDLQRMLADTVDAVSATPDGDPWHAVLSDEDRARLREVVRVRGGDATLDLALAADLVGAVLPRALVAIADDPKSQRLLMERIAQSLLDDPRAARRLQDLLTAIAALLPDDGEPPQ